MKKYVYSEAKQVVVCGGFARAGRSHNLVGWASKVTPRDGGGRKIGKNLQI